MNLKFKTGIEFEEFKDKLRNKLKKRDIVRIDESNLKKAAVMILIMNKNNEAHVLLTKRSENVKTHKGHMSFPGGGIDSNDKNILETALRETFEEVGVKFNDIEIMGEFDEFLSIMGFHVSAFIGTIYYPYKYSINYDEIDDYVEVPLSIFLNKKYDRIDNMSFMGNDLDVYYYYFQEYLIWGLTARILTELADEVLKD